MKLDVGMYVRTNKGKITQYYGDFSNNAIVNGIYTDKEHLNWLYKNDVVKASYNIIDLIEVGDYVNGYRVITHKFFNNEEPVKAIQTINENGEVCYSALNSQRLSNENIKLIVTKEQFKSMEYMVKE